MTARFHGGPDAQGVARWDFSSNANACAIPLSPMGGNKAWVLLSSSVGEFTPRLA